MATVEVDQLEGASAAHKLMEGWMLTRICRVLDLEVAASGPALIAAAEAELIAVIGDRGSSCPDISVPTYLDEFVPEPISATAVKFRVIYKGFPRPTISFRGSLYTVQSNKDLWGNVLKRQYIYPANYDLDETKRGKLVTQGQMMERAVPEEIVAVKFLVTNGYTLGPGFPVDGGFSLALGFLPNGSYTVGLGGTCVLVSAAVAMSYLNAHVGCINDNYYNLGFQTADPHFCRIDDVSGTTRDGTVYEAEMVFHFRRGLQGFDPLVTFINPDTGMPPHDLVDASSSPAYSTGTVGGTVTTQTYPGNGTESSQLAIPFPIFVFGPN